MSKLAWATEIKEENYNAIVSEAGRTFDLAFLKKWVVLSSGTGYFLRDPSSPLDCCLLDVENFNALYTFDHNDEGALFRQVTAI